MFKCLPDHAELLFEIIQIVFFDFLFKLFNQILICSYEMRMSSPAWAGHKAGNLLPGTEQRSVNLKIIGSYIKFFRKNLIELMVLHIFIFSGFQAGADK